MKTTKSYFFLFLLFLLTGCLTPLTKSPPPLIIYTESSAEVNTIKDVEESIKKTLRACGYVVKQTTKYNEVITKRKEFSENNVVVVLDIIITIAFNDKKKSADIRIAYEMLWRYAGAPNKWRHHDDPDINNPKENLVENKILKKLHLALEESIENITLEL
ncbi:hypothetical protein QQ020_21575 [Fulvivirgaceae bacterium BMA12]|uniref:Lipoprotein n=1 Tax=Agaribacillus aureus TaxID=3051825 RepID=A0ABT8LAB9_9BACT|nr:hypothetical protein [Fulvivirgaceae bacterium BMA12]